jgi:hypothetical protein
MSTEQLGDEHIDKQGRLHVPVTCFFDKAPPRDGWRVVWSEATGDLKWPRIYIYKKSESKEKSNEPKRVEGDAQEDE